MIELYDIIEAANTFVHPSKGTLVLNRSIREHPKFKVYKVFCYHVYLVNGDKKDKVLSWEHTINSPAENMLNDWKNLDKEFLKQLIPWLTSEFYTDLRNGI